MVSDTRSRVYVYISGSLASLDSRNVELTTGSHTGFFLGRGTVKSVCHGVSFQGVWSRPQHIILFLLPIILFSNSQNNPCNYSETFSYENAIFIPELFFFYIILKEIPE